MMSAICTDRQLPSILNDYGKDGDHSSVYGGMLFDRLFKHVSVKQS